MAFVFSCRESMKHCWRRSAMLNHRHHHHHHHHLCSFATATTPKFAPIAADAATAATHYPAKPSGKEWGEWVPIMVLGAMIATGMSVGAHTAKQQLCHSPGVQVRKKKREMVSEVDNPDAVVSSADKFLNKSFFRKVAHIQNSDALPDSGIHNNPFTRSREIENLESVGVPYRDYRH